jgi:hypothetical protein
MIRSLLVLVCLLWVAPWARAAYAAAAPLRVVMAASVSIDKDPAGHDSVRKAVATKLNQLGIELLPDRPGLAKCRTAACLAKVQKATGASHVVVLGVKYLREHSFHIALTVIDAGDAHVVAEKKSDCALICMWPDMYAKLDELLAEAMKPLMSEGASVVSVAAPVTEPQSKAKAARPEPVPEASTPAMPPPELSTSVAQPTQEMMATSVASEESAGHTRAWVLLAGGVAAAAGGGWILSQNGDLKDCLQPGDDSTCRHSKDTRVPGIGLLVVGGAAMTIGVLDLFDVFTPKKSSASARLLVGPTAFAFAGRF